ncbi:MAG: FmdB family zinc ribbon protein [Chloroflexota bacterium]|nr:FmdB family zinc ribbon protein [Chloroflexota bacterium]
MYEYACQSGGHRFEVKQRFTDAPLSACIECGAPVRRVIFPAGIVFKGSGFYKTDYANGSRSDGASSDSAASDSTSESKSETAASAA